MSCLLSECIKAPDRVVRSSVWRPPAGVPEQLRGRTSAEWEWVRPTSAHFVLFEKWSKSHRKMSTAGISLGTRRSAPRPQEVFSGAIWAAVSIFGTKAMSRDGEFKGRGNIPTPDTHFPKAHVSTMSRASQDHEPAVFQAKWPLLKIIPFDQTEREEWYQS